MENLQRNPFPVEDAFGHTIGWQWLDETGNIHGKVYPDQLTALQDLLRYVKYLNHGPSIWQRMWWPLRYGLWPWLGGSR